ncbi:YetF domain-containing protein [Chelativorans sp.]|uniref:DUF421 domain-containing protein n=1 Tax=Chelativorans sp. TaxID=2203393 RepID=UPI0028126A5B|nr:YetF domain-containing protein [Chelativorans sp.]
MDSVIRGIVIYLFLLVVVRLSGRRTLAEMTAFDFVIILIVAETTQQALLGDDFSLTNAFLLILTLFVTDIAFSYFKQWSPRSAELMDGVPTVLISLGNVDEEALTRARVSLEDVLEAAREQHGLERLDQIKFAVLEVGGNISIIPAEAK